MCHQNDPFHGATGSIWLANVQGRSGAHLLEISDVKVTFASYHTVSVRHGGPLTQMKQTKKYLQEIGIDVELIDMWKPRGEFLDTDLFHIFSANLGVWDLANYLKEHSKRYVVNPIFYTRWPPLVVRSVCLFDSMTHLFTRGVTSLYSFTRDVCLWAERVLPNTTVEAALVSKGLGIPEGKITLIPNGVDGRFLNGDPELFSKEYGIKDFILNVGHIGVERKNVLSLIRALSDIDHPAVIIGHIYPCREADRCLEEAKKNKNLLIIPGLDHDSPMLSSAYAACRVFALPALFETPGIAALEAALAGASVVITSRGGTSEYFGGMATYVNPYSVPSIRKGITEALEQDPTDRLKKHIQENFLWQRVAEKTTRVYKEITGE